MLILKMYITIIPVILAGIMNMLFVKTRLYSQINRPMDGGKTLRDGKRLFGDNKTWAGFFGMVLSSALAQLLWGFVCLGFPDMCFIGAATRRCLILPRERLWGWHMYYSSCQTAL